MRKSIVIVVFMMLGAILLNYIEAEPQYRLEQNAERQAVIFNFVENVAKTANAAGIQVILDGKPLEERSFSCYLNEDSQVMMPLFMLRDDLGCKLTYLEDGNLPASSAETIQVEVGSTKLTMTVGSNEAEVNGIALQMKASVAEQDGTVYIPILDIAGYIYIKGEYSLLDNSLLLSKLPHEEILPEVYDMRAEGRVTSVRNQGHNGNCWAYAAVGALETVCMPEEEYSYSASHMSKNSGYSVESNAGGDYVMAVAYLARWDGPVLRKTDSGNDAETKRVVQKHLEEAVFIKSKDYRAIKEYVYKYGGVQSSIYINLELQDDEGGSKYYNEDTHAYYFDEQDVTNHDIVIVGWDDHYPKENFKVVPEGDGAFLCKNSWGEQFGDAGYFYISYYDSNIGTTNTCYTKLGDADNFDYIYQSDQLGWIGELGFDASNAYFANVFETHETETLEAVSFYATDVNTTYKVYVVQEYQGQESLKNRRQVAEGSFAYAGYYTVHLDEVLRLAAGTKYAVVVYIDTPDSVHPVAIEYNASEKTETFDITDGESYVSLYGESWTNLEAGQSANVCLKAFTKKAD
ncbi:MAG: hypothetical protein K2G89_09615 [Lachnospiraceae bacterium]|nr:hypothetical protein [Lachnospiraceae bacterium]